jgi:hypothetical protein
MNKNVLKSILLTFTSLFMVVVVFAQANPETGKKPAESKQGQAQQVQSNQNQRPATPSRPNLYREFNQVPNLSAEQKQEFNKLRTEYFKLQRDLMQEKADDAKMKSQLEAKMKEHQKKFTELLKDNKEQMEYYNKNIEGKTYSWEKPTPVKTPSAPAKPADVSQPPVEKKVNSAEQKK